MSNIGFRIFLKVKRPAQEIVDGFRNYQAAVIGDALGRLSVMDASIKSMNEYGVKMVGTALTVRTIPTDNLLVHKALELAQPGDVIVIATGGGSRGPALIGGNIVAKAEKIGIAGFVLDAPIRDIDDIRKSKVPVFATGLTPAGPFKNGPGEINVGITCGGVFIKPGDILVGDDDGVVVVDKKEAETILQRAQKLAQKEEEKGRAIEAGDLFPEEIDQSLLAKGCEFIDQYWDK
ncbi:MAG: RraA family protein [bacterium]